MQLQYNTSLKGQDKSRTAYQSASYSTKNMNFVKIQGQDFAIQPQRQMQFSGSQVQLTPEQAAARYTLQQSSEALIKPQKKVKIMATGRDNNSNKKPGFVGVPYGGGRNHVNDEYRSNPHPASMVNVSNDYINNATQNLGHQSKSLSGLSSYTGRVAMATDGFAYPFLDPTASNTAALTGSHHFLNSTEALALSASGSKVPQYMSQGLNGSAQYQNQLLAAKNMDRLRKGRAQSAVKRDQSRSGVQEKFVSAQHPVTTEQVEYPQGPLTNPNILQAYNYQDLMNSSYISNNTTYLSQGQDPLAMQMQNAPIKIGGKVKQQRPTSAAVRPGQQRTLQDRQIQRTNQVGYIKQFDDQSAVYGLPNSSNQFQQLPDQANLRASKEMINDGSYEIPSQGSVDGILTVLNQYRNRTGATQQSYNTEQGWMPPQDTRNRYQNEDFVQLGQSREQFHYPEQKYSSKLNQLKVSRNSGANPISTFTSGMGRVDSGASQYATSKRLVQQNKKGVPSEAQSGVTRHTIASSEKRKLPLRPTTAQQRSRLAFAVHGLTHKESVEELAEKEMLGLDTQFSQGNISVARTNKHGQSHTRLSSGRASQVVYARQKYPYQQKSIFMNKISEPQALNSNQREAGSQLVFKRGQRPSNHNSPPQGLNRFSQVNDRKQSVQSKITQQQISAPNLAIKSQASLSNRQRPKTAAIGRSHRVNQLKTTTGTIGMSASYIDQSQHTDNETAFTNYQQRPKSKTTLRQKDGNNNKANLEQRTSTILSSVPRQKGGEGNDSYHPNKSRQLRVTIADSRMGNSEKEKIKSEKPLPKRSMAQKQTSIRPYTAQRDKPSDGGYDLNLLSQILKHQTKEGPAKDDKLDFKQQKKDVKKQDSPPQKKGQQKNAAENNSSGNKKQNINQGTGRMTNSSQPGGKFSTYQDDQQSISKSDKLFTQTSMENIAGLDMKLTTIQSDVLLIDENDSEGTTKREFNCLSRSMQDHNSIVRTYLSVLDQMEESGAGMQGLTNSKLSKSLAGVDCQAKLLRASQDMKAIRFHCNYLITRDVDRLIDIKVASRGDATRGPDNVVDLIKNCPLFCKISLKGRKQPIKIIMRQNDRIPSLAEFGDLKICVSHEHKNPTPAQCIRSYQNPGGVLSFQDPSEWPEVKEMETGKKDVPKDKLAVQDSYQNLFTTEELYLSFSSEKNCTFNIICQFPKELGMDDDKPKKKERTNIRSEKALRAKFTDEIQTQIRELEHDANKRDKYFNYIMSMKYKLQRRTLKESETDFRALNVVLVRNLMIHLRNQSMARQEIDNKIEEARLRRDQREEERLEELKFESVKWDLYRMRVDQIEDDYADFKRVQKKINTWLFIALRHIAIKIITNKFRQGQARVALFRKKTIMHGRIRRHFANYLKVKGQPDSRRLKFWLRDSLTVSQLPMAFAQKKMATRLIHAFLKTESVFYNTKKKVSDFRDRVVFIQLQIKKMIITRHVRTQVIDDFFEKEVAIMKKHYTERAKKVKKLRTKIQALSQISRQSKQLIITAYMKKISFQNMVDSLFYQANLYLQKGLRPEGRLSDDEYRNIQSLMQNQMRMQTFLFDGIKENEPVGNHVDENLKLNVYTLSLLEHLKELSNLKPGSTIPPSVTHVHSSQQPAGVVKPASPSPTRALTRKDSLDSAAGLDLIALDDMDAEGQGGDGAGGAEGTGGEEKKKSSESKSKGKSSGGAKKGGGGKKGKKASKKAKAEEEIELDWNIPKDKDSQGLNLFLPDRTTMQMMINRAISLKDWERLPELDEIRPWIKVKNRDVMI